MKRGIIIIAGSVLVALLMNACRKTGTAPPQITLIGDTTVTVSLNSNYVDQGVTVVDERDGTDAVSSDFSSTNPNTDIAGSYIIHYYTTDNNGNSTTAKRKVKVVNDAQNMAGLYKVVETVTGKNAGSYTDTVNVTASSTLNNELLISNFGGFGKDVTVFTIMSVNSVFLSPTRQSPSGMNDPGSITGTGTKAGNKITNFTYDVTYSSLSDHSTSGWTKLTPPF